MQSEHYMAKRVHTYVIWSYTEDDFSEFSEPQSLR